ncbi:MAG: hypothetical protein IJD65_06090 [Mailhella sp.]|nr:hypothetical protein [Mailhella sp.]
MPRFIPHSPEPTPRQMLALASGLNAALRGDCANAGLLEVPAGASSAAVQDSRCRAGRLALLIPLDANAAALRWHLAAMERGSMRFGFAGPAPAPCRFGWMLAGEGAPE